MSFQSKHNKMVDDLLYIYIDGEMPLNTYSYEQTQKNSA